MSPAFCSWRRYPEGVRVAHHHHLLVALQELPDRLCNEVGVFHVGDRHVGARHPADLARVAAGRVDHHVAHDVTLIGEDLPLAARTLLHVRHQGTTRDGRAHVPRAPCEGVAAAGGVHMAVPDGPRTREDPVHVHERIDLPDLLRVDDLALEADELADARDVVEPFDFRRLHREPDAAAPVPAHVLPGLLLELRVEPDPVVVDLRHVVVGDEARALARRVPGRAGSQLPLLHEQEVGPPLLGEVVEQPHSHHSPTDDDDSRVCLHGALQRCDPGVPGNVSGNFKSPGFAMQYRSLRRIHPKGRPRRPGRKSPRAATEAHTQSRGNTSFFCPNLRASDVRALLMA